MISKKNLYNILNIREGEGTTVLLPLIYTFFTGASLAFFVTAATSLFLSSFDREMLPLAFIAAGILVLSLGKLYAGIQKKVSYPKLLTGGTLTLLFSVVLFMLLYIGTESAAAIFLLYAWIRVFVYLHAVTFWGLAGKLFTLRQGKRIFGLITGGEVFASILSFLSVPFLLKIIKTEDLLLISGVSLMFAFMILLYIVKKYKHKLSVGDKTGRENKETQKSEKDGEITKTKYYKLFALIAFLPIFAQFFVDFIFQAQAKTEFPEREFLTAFVGIFFGVSAVVEFVLKTFVSGKLMSKYGMKFGLTAFPAMLFISFLFASFFGLIYGAFTLFFSFVSLGRLFTRAVRTAFNDPATQILFQPLPPEQRTVLQNKIESGPKAFASIAAGIVLFAFTKIPGISLVWFSVFLLVIIVFWHKTAEKMFAEYKRTVQNILKNRKTSKNLSENQKILNYILSIKDNLSPDNKKILFDFCKIVFPYKTDIIFGEKNKNKVKYKLKELIEFAHSDNPEKRKLAAEMFAFVNFYKIEIFLNKLLNDDNFNVRVAAIITAGKIKEPELFKYLFANLRINEYHDSAFSAVINTGNKILNELDGFFYKAEFTPDLQISVIKLTEYIGTEKAVKILQNKINYTSKPVANAVISALSNLKYKAKRSDSAILEEKLDEEIFAFVYVSACLKDLKTINEKEDIIRALKHEKRNKIDNIFKILSLIYDSGAIELIKTNLDSDNREDRGFALEVADMTFSDIHKQKISGILESSSETEVTAKYKYMFPQESLNITKRLIDIINSEITVTGNYTKTIAVNMISQYGGKDVITVLKANITHPDYLIKETAAVGLYFCDKELFSRQIEILKYSDKEIESIKNKITVKNKSSNMLVLEKLKFLKSLDAFTDISYKKLTKLAVYTADFSLKPGENITVDTEKEPDIFLLCVLGSIKNTQNKYTVNTGEFAVSFNAEKQEKIVFTAEEPALIFKGKTYLLYNLFAENLNFAKKITNNIIYPI